MPHALICNKHSQHLLVSSGKLEGAMKDMVATVAKGLDKAQTGMAARVANTFTVLWWAHCL